MARPSRMKVSRPARPSRPQVFNDKFFIDDTETIKAGGPIRLINSDDTRLSNTKRAFNGDIKTVTFKGRKYKTVGVETGVDPDIAHRELNESIKKSRNSGKEPIVIGRYFEQELTGVTKMNVHLLEPKNG